MAKEISKHPEYKPDMTGVDFSKFKVMLVYANSPMDNLFSVGLSSIAGTLRELNIDYKIFDTTWYPNDGRLGENKAHLMEIGSKNHHELLMERAQVAEFDFKEVGIEYIETNVFDDFRKEVEEYKPNVIFLSTVEPTHQFGSRLLEKVRDLGIPHIVGGCFAIFTPEIALKDPNVDYVCTGEGEYTTQEFCKALATGANTKNIPGIWAKNGDELIKNKKAPLVNMDHLPMLDFSRYDPKRIFRPMSGRLYRMVPIEFSRGCPYKCTFCSAPVFEEQFKEVGTWSRAKPIDQIEKEMKYYIKEFNVEYFYFVSETFLAMPKQRFYDFCEMYKKIKLPFWFNTRPETITDEKVKMLEEINCHRMSIGIESGNYEYARKMLLRNAKTQVIIDAVNRVADSNIQISVNNVIGMPDETREMMFDTIELNRQVRAHSHSVCIFQPYHGTSLHNYCVRKGYFGKDEFAEDSTYASPLTQPHITHSEIQGLSKTFVLYVKFPKNMWDFIKIAEEDTERGRKMHKELLYLYKRDYAPQSESDVGGGTRIIVDLTKVYPGNVMDRLNQIKEMRV